jgi:hypothetical protein
LLDNPFLIEGRNDNRDEQPDSLRSFSTQQLPVPKYNDRQRGCHSYQRYGGGVG